MVTITPYCDSPANGSLLLAAGTETARDIAFDSAGNLYYSSQGNNFIGMKGTDGGVAKIFDGSYLSPGNADCSQPSTILVKADDSALWAMDYTSAYLCLIDMKGNILNKYPITTNATRKYTTIEGPMQYDNDGNILLLAGFYIDGSGNTDRNGRVEIYKFDVTSLTWSTLFPSSVFPDSASYSTPYGLAVDTNGGYIYAAFQNTNSPIARFNMNGTGSRTDVSISGYDASTRNWGKMHVTSTGILYAQDMKSDFSDYRTQYWPSGIASPPVELTPAPGLGCNGDVNTAIREYNGRLYCRYYPIQSFTLSNLSDIRVEVNVDYMGVMIPLGYPYNRFLGLSQNSKRMSLFIKDASLTQGLGGLIDYPITTTIDGTIQYMLERDGTLYASTNSSVYAVDMTTGALTPFITGYSNLGPMVFGPGGDLFIADGSTLKKFNPDGTSPVTIATGFTIENNFTDVVDSVRPKFGIGSIAVDPFGNVFVATIGFGNGAQPLPTPTNTPPAWRTIGGNYVYAVFVDIQLIKLTANAWSQTVLETFNSATEGTRMYVSTYTEGPSYHTVSVSISLADNSTTAILSPYHWDPTLTLMTDNAVFDVTATYSPQLMNLDQNIAPYYPIYPMVQSGKMAFTPTGGGPIIQMCLPIL